MPPTVTKSTIILCRKLRPHKESLFAPLSAAAAAAAQRAPECGGPSFRVLELGGGSGANFEFVTSPVEWTVTEPNKEFAPYFKANVAEKGGRHTVKDLVEVRRKG